MSDASSPEITTFNAVQAVEKARELCPHQSCRYAIALGLMDVYKLGVLEGVERMSAYMTEPVASSSTASPKGTTR